MRKGLLATVMVVLMAAVGNALTVRLSVDGINPAPDAINVVPGEVLCMYVISDSDGTSYFKWIHTDEPARISNVEGYPAAGDVASITDLSTELISEFRLEADDSGGNIQAGKHFGFDVMVGAGATPGSVRDVWLDSGVIPDDSVAVNVVPEPGTVLLLGLRGLVLLRIRKRK